MQDGKTWTNSDDHGRMIEQATLTGPNGERLYSTRVMFLTEDATKRYEAHGGEVVRFEFETAFADPALVKGALTPTVADWRLVIEKSTQFPLEVRCGCYMHARWFEADRTIVELLLLTEAVEVIAFNIEGRIVQGDVPL